MEYSPVGPGQEISAEGVVYDKGSRYGRLQTLTDLRKARGKRYSLTTVLMIERGKFAYRDCGVGRLPSVRSRGFVADQAETHARKEHLSADIGLQSLRDRG